MTLPTRSWTSRRSGAMHGTRTGSGNWRRDAGARCGSRPNHPAGRCEAGRPSRRPPPSVPPASWQFPVLAVKAGLISSAGLSASEKVAVLHDVETAAATGNNQTQVHVASDSASELPVTHGR